MGGSEAIGGPAAPIAQVLLAALAFYFLNAIFSLPYWQDYFTRKLRANARPNHVPDPVEIRKASRLAASRITGMVHNGIQIPLALSVLTDPRMSGDDLLYVHTWQSTTLCAISSGYFLLDIWLVIHNQEGAAYLAHGVVCFATYLVGLMSGYQHYFDAAHLLFELSTLFVHLRWWLYKIGQSDGLLYTINGGLMVITFFLCRNVWGTYCMLRYAPYAWEALRTAGGVPAWQVLLSGGSMVFMTALNGFWMYKMGRVVHRVLAGGHSLADASDMHGKDD